MKRTHLMVGLLAVLACSGLYAQARMQAVVPFDFRMGEAMMPAGEYKISQSQSVLTMREDNWHRSAMVLTIPASRRKAQTTGLLEFNRYGNAFFLTAVWTPESDFGGVLHKSRQEKELAGRAAPVRTAVIARRPK